MLCFFFFFSSRRRHTRFSRDWSSDVCSSDLRLYRVQRAIVLRIRRDIGEDRNVVARAHLTKKRFDRGVQRYAVLAGPSDPKIGRASCRERVVVAVVAAALKEEMWRRTATRIE